MLVIESCNIFSPYWQILENFFKTQVVTKRFWKNFQAFPNILISGYQRGEFLEFFSNSISWLLAKEKKNLEIGNTQEKCFSKIVWKIFRKSFWLMSHDPDFPEIFGKTHWPMPRKFANKGWFIIYFVANINKLYDGKCFVEKISVRLLENFFNSTVMFPTSKWKILFLDLSNFRDVSKIFNVPT